MTENIILVHGYNSRPGDKKHGPSKQFDQWEDMFREFDCIRYPWDSALNFNLSDMFRAWMNGYRTTYGLAYGKLSKEAGERLVFTAPRHQLVFGHSLGTKVIIDALRNGPGMFKRVIFCNGAVLAKDALPVIRDNPEIQFLNIACREDDTLAKLGANFSGSRGRCIGNGLELEELPDNMEQVILDDPDAQEYFDSRDLKIRGDDPDNYGDHSFSFEWKGNWSLFTEFMKMGKLP